MTAEPPVDPTDASKLGWKRILLATDFGESSNRAAEYAVWLARAFQAELVLLHVWEIPVFISYSAASGAFFNDLERQAREKLDSAQRVVAEQGLRATSDLRRGVAWQGILEAIDDAHPDLVIVGSHGFRALEHVLLGSVAEKVTRLSPVPVLVVRSGGPRKVR